MDGFGSRLKTWRKKLGLTQLGFSESTGIHVAQIKKYELGTSLPSGEIMAKIADTGVNLNWLIAGQGPMILSQNQESQSPLPPTLSEFEDRFKAIFNLLQGMDEEKRSSTVNELFGRVQELQRVDEMEKIIKEMKKALEQAG